MKQVSTRTHILLQIALALSVATYIGLRNHLLVLSGIFLGASIVFSFLAVLSHLPMGQRRGKLMLLTVCSVVCTMLFFCYILKDWSQEVSITKSLPIDCSNVQPHLHK